MPTNRVKEYRTQAGYSQGRLAQILGVSTGIVNSWENGEMIKSSKNLMQMVALFGCTVNELMGFPEEDVSVTA